LVFGWLSNPNATIEELTQTAATLAISITPQGLDKRFTPVCAHFIKKVLESAVETVIAEKPVAIPVLHRFNVWGGGKSTHMHTHQLNPVNQFTV